MKERIRLILKKHCFELDVDITPLVGHNLGIYGDSGSGKTTLLRCLAGLEPTQGCIEWLETSWLNATLSVPTHLRQLAYVTQHPVLLNHLSVTENICFASHGQPPPLEQIVEGMALQPLLHKSVATLSGGERQRVAIARSIWQNPRVMLLDEAVSALHIEARHQVLKFLKTYCQAQGIRLVVVSHSMDELARIADSILVMTQGRIQYQAPLNQALTDFMSPVAQRMDAFSLLQGYTSGYDSRHQLQKLKLGDRTLYCPVVEAIPEGQALTVQINARDISLTRSEDRTSSILNRLPVTIIAVDQQALAGQQLVQLACEGQTLLARLSSLSVERLNIRAGEQLFAQIKAVALCSL